MQLPTNKKAILIAIFGVCFIVGFGLTLLLSDGKDEDTHYGSIPESDVSIPSESSTDGETASPPSTPSESASPIEVGTESPEEAVELPGSANKDKASAPVEPKKEPKSSSPVQGADKQTVKETGIGNEPKPAPKPAPPMLTSSQMKQMLKTYNVDESKTSSLQIRAIGQRDDDVKVGNDPFDVYQKIKTGIWADIQVVNMTHDDQGRITSVTIRPVYPK